MEAFGFLGTFPLLMILPMIIMMVVFKPWRRNRRSSMMRMMSWMDSGGDPDDDRTDVRNREDKAEKKFMKLSNDEKEARVLGVAQKYDGKLTVSDMAIETGITIKEAEKVLNRIVDHVRVTLEVRENGLMEYEFKEIVNRREKTRN